MESLIKALQIFLKYGNPEYPIHCEHDVLYVDIDPGLVSDDDKNKLKELGFESGEDSDDWTEGFYSFKFGSC